MPILTGSEEGILGRVAGEAADDVHAVTCHCATLSHAAAAAAAADDDDHDDDDDDDDNVLRSPTRIYNSSDNFSVNATCVIEGALYSLL